MSRVIKHIVLIFALCAVVCANALQYTHDVSHHDCESACDSNNDHADTCSLCWFVYHQILSDVHLDVVFIEPYVQSFLVHENDRYTAFLPLPLVHQESNKDPPYFLA